MPYNEFRIAAFSDESSGEFEGQLNALLRNSLDAMEMRKVDGKNVVELTLDEAKEYRKRLAEKGLSVWSLGSPIGKSFINEPFDKQLEAMRRALEIADILAAPAMRIFSFYIPEGSDPDIYRDEVIDRLGSFTALAKSHRITLCHENEKGIFGDIPRRCLLLHRALPSLKSVFDPANFVQCGTDTPAAYELLKDYIFYLHIKDAKLSGEIVPAGDGDGNIAEIISRYKENGGSLLTLEPHLFEFDGLSSLERKGEESKVGGYGFKTAEEAFDYAADSLKKILGGI